MNQLTEEQVYDGAEIQCTESYGAGSCFTQGQLYQVLKVSDEVDEESGAKIVYIIDDRDIAHEWCMESLTGKQASGEDSKLYADWNVKFTYMGEDDDS